MLKIPLKLDDIKIQKILINEKNEYHIYVSCTGTVTGTKCHRCQKFINKSHGQSQETVIEHLPILDEKLFIHVKWPRYICSNCDDNPTTTFRPDWLNQNGDMTKMYEKLCLKQLINSTIKDSAIKLKTTEAKIQGVVDRNINTDINWSEINPKKIGIDEIALRKGHNQYLTIISDISETSKVKILGVVKGRKKEDVLPFFNKIPKYKLLNLESICSDMGASYLSLLKEVIDDISIFNEIVTVDRFHVAQLVGKAVDSVRKITIKELQAKYSKNEVIQEILKNSMWPIRHHFNDLDFEQQKKLNEIFSLTPHLKNCYELREELYQIFEKNYTKEEARIKIDEWCNKAQECNNNGNYPFNKFVKTYKKFEENILNYFHTKASSGPVEGLNNKVKVVKRRGFGFRNILQFTQRLFLDFNYKCSLLPNSY